MKVPAAEAGSFFFLCRTHFAESLPLMSSQSNDAGDFGMSQYETHVCLVSGQAAANFLPVVEYHPKRVVLLASSRMKKAAVALEKSIKSADPGIKVEIASLSDETNFNKTTEEILSVLERLQDGKPAVNITGGTKIMSVAALSAASCAGNPAFYLNQDTSHISVFPEGKIEREAVLKDIEFKPKLKLHHYLAAYGYETNVTKRHPALPLTEDERAFIEDMFRDKDYQKALPFVNGFITTKEIQKSVRKRTVGFTESFKMDLGVGRQKAVQSFVNRLRELGLAKCKDGELEFPGEKERYFVAGGWMERHVAVTLESMGLQPFGNVNISNGSDNEIDVAFFKDNRFFVIECKTCTLSDIDKANACFYKVNNLRGVGGSNTRTVLMSFYPVDEDAKSRAANSHVKVMEAKELSPAYIKNTISRYLERVE